MISLVDVYPPASVDMWTQKRWKQPVRYSLTISYRQKVHNDLLYMESVCFCMHVIHISGEGWRCIACYWWGRTSYISSNESFLEASFFFIRALYVWREFAYTQNFFLNMEIMNLKTMNHSKLWMTCLWVDHLQWKSMLREPCEWWLADHINVPIIKLPLLHVLIVKQTLWMI